MRKGKSKKRAKDKGVKVMNSDLKHANLIPTDTDMSRNTRGQNCSIKYHAQMGPSEPQMKM